MKPFPRRMYAGFGDFWQDLRFVIRNRPGLQMALRSDLISEKFRERLMLMVTQVNGCRYCSYFHAKEALKAGISDEALASLLAGVLPEDTPEDEILALLYAQHWAEADSHPEPGIYQKMVTTYGVEKSEAIEMILRMIRIGNLSGNLGDYLLYRLSFGRWGLLENEAR